MRSDSRSTARMQLQGPYTPRTPPPPCRTDPKCKYAAKARLDDKVLPWLQNMHAVNTEMGLAHHCNWAIENPDAGMKLRPYAKLENWPEPLMVSRKTVD